MLIWSWYCSWYYAKLLVSHHFSPFAPCRRIWSWFTHSSAGAVITACQSHQYKYCTNLDPYRLGVSSFMYCPRGSLVFAVLVFLFCLFLSSPVLPLSSLSGFVVTVVVDGWQASLAICFLFLVQLFVLLCPGIYILISIILGCSLLWHKAYCGRSADLIRL